MRGLLCAAWDACMGLTTVFVFAQVGDGTTMNLCDRPVAVAGLSSGVAMVALGGVRRVIAV